MTTKPKPDKPAPKASAPKRRRCVTEAEVASLDFKPWEGPINYEKLPTNEKFIEDGLGHLVTCRFALAIMYKTKGELMEILGEMDNDTGRALMDEFFAATGFFSHFLKLLNAGEARIICAGSSYGHAVSVADRSLRRIVRSHGRAAHD